jgi:uncharacterized membrane-anchored protein
MTDHAAPHLHLPGGTAGNGAFRMDLKKFAIALLLVAAAQTAALGWMIAARVNLINNGQEVVLKIIPVDPRSLFRGDYVILSYDISRLDTGKLAGHDTFQRGAFVYVTLTRDAQGNWAASRLSPTISEGRNENQAVIRGKIRSSGKRLRIKYGIESYFVAEGGGKRLEKLAGDKKLSALIAIGPDGEAAIKGLLIDGVLQYEEPLF